MLVVDLAAKNARGLQHLVLPAVLLDVLFPFSDLRLGRRLADRLAQSSADTCNAIPVARGVLGDLPATSIVHGCTSVAAVESA